ncbi:DUF6701 domain-containing protein [Vibrio intestinalis]|uniref:DUF6701 domain-containing protein n=1 Tax=Vibrio intestinalis TaxID=2933291 RepID=UPI0021A2D0D3|nr:DUF6701 domain-containing protein [Vibrio intestinalis]
MMKQILWMLLLPLVSFISWADDDEIRTCNIKLNKDFTILVDYGENDDDSLSSMGSDDFDDETLYITNRSNNNPVKIWADESDEGALFYDDLDDDEHNEIRIDFTYQSKKAQQYTGKFTYYLKKNGTWLEQASKVETIDVGTKHAQALIDEDDDREELHNLRCDDALPPIEPPVFSLDVCPYVPNTVQTNNLASGAPFGALHVNTHSENYVQIAGEKSEFFLSSVTNAEVCRTESGKMVKCDITSTPPIEPWPPTLTWEATQKGKDITCDSNCSLDGDADVYRKLTINRNATVVLTGGKYYFEELKFADSHASLQIEGPTEIHYKKIMFEKPGVSINAKRHAFDPDDFEKTFDPNNLYDPNDTYEPLPSKSLLIVGHGKDANFAPKNDAHAITINGYVHVNYHSEMADNGFTFSATYNKLTGGVTSHSIALAGRNNTIHTGSLDCYDTSPKIAAINIIPNNFHLTCEDDKYVDVEALDSDGIRITDFDAGTKSITLVSSQLTFSEGGFDPSSGLFRFKIDTKNSNNSEAVPVTASVIADTTIKDSSDVVFVPLKFNVNDGQELEMIAGYDDHQISIKTMACNADGKQITGNYSKTLTQDNLQVSSFSPGLWDDSKSDLSMTAAFNNGVADASIVFNDAGQYVGQLVDSVSCDDFGQNVRDCPSGQTQTIKGELKFKARPWTFAVCGYGSTAGGDSNSGDAFMPAGKVFDLTAKPVIYSSALDTYQSKQKLKGDEFCKLQVTDNFFKNDSAYNSQVELSHGVATPAGGQDGALSYAGPQNNYDGVSSIALNDVSVSEVGSFHFAVSGNDTSFYAGILGGIDIGQREIGRFYPNRFSITASSFQGESQQEHIAYMGQPFFLTQIMIGAYAFDSTSALQNYYLFAPSLQADFAAKQDSVVNNELRFSADLAAINWSAPDPAISLDSYWILNDLDAQVTRSLVKTETVSGKTVMFTQPNGPFNDGVGTTTTDFGFTISGSDPVSFSDTTELLEQAFPTQPTVRYGRMVMGSSGGTSEHTLNVPLRVEYWNGSAFMINEDDSFSKLTSNGSNVCKQILWQDDEDSGSDSALSGVSSVQSVSSGLYQGLQATPNSSNEREQDRFWIMLDDTAETPAEHTSPQRLLSDVSCGASGLNQPWLQYNWRGQGDEDPSTVATFGIFRGNDKVIFRAEPNLVGN